MATPVGDFFTILEKKQEIHDKCTKKAEQRNIVTSEYMPPPVHISFLMEGKHEDEEDCHFLIFHNRVVYEHGDHLTLLKIGFAWK